MDNLEHQTTLLIHFNALIAVQLAKHVIMSILTVLHATLLLIFIVELVSMIVHCKLNQVMGI